MVKLLEISRLRWTGPWFSRTAANNTQSCLNARQIQVWDPQNVCMFWWTHPTIWLFQMIPPTTTESVVARWIGGRCNKTRILRLPLEVPISLNNAKRVGEELKGNTRKYWHIKRWLSCYIHKTVLSMRTLAENISSRTHLDGSVIYM